MIKMLVTLLAIAVIRIFWEESLEEESKFRKVIYLLCSLLIVTLTLLWIIN